MTCWPSKSLKTVYSLSVKIISSLFRIIWEIFEAIPCRFSMPSFSTSCSLNRLFLSLACYRSLWRRRISTFASFLSFSSSGMHFISSFRVSMISSSLLMRVSRSEFYFYYCRLRSLSFLISSSLPLKSASLRARSSSCCLSWSSRGWMLNLSRLRASMTSKSVILFLSSAFYSSRRLFYSSNDSFSTTRYSCFLRYSSIWVASS